MRRFTILVYVLLAAQIVSAAVVIAFLADSKIRTGWAQTYSAFCAVLAWIEALGACVFRTYSSQVGRVGAIISDTMIALVTVLVTVGVGSLICNTEDGQHTEQGLVNAVESAAMALTLTWGFILVRLGGRYVEFASELEKENPIIYDARL